MRQAPLVVTKVSYGTESMAELVIQLVEVLVQNNALSPDVTRPSPSRKALQTGQDAKHLEPDAHQRDV